MAELEKDRLDAAFEAYWAAEGGTFKGIEAAIVAYLNAPSSEAKEYDTMLATGVIPPSLQLRFKKEPRT